MSMSTSTISDALDVLGVGGQVFGVRNLVPGATCVGPAFTVSFRPVGDPRAGLAADYLDDVPAGAVVVLDNYGREDCTVWGDLLTEYASIRRVAGTVVWGAVRDTASFQRLGYPVFAAATWMRTGKGRVALESVGRAIEVGGVRVVPGDIVVADDDGVVCVPAAHWPRAQEIAQGVELTEAAIRSDMAAGHTLAAARRARGYHDLRLSGGGGRV